MCRQRKSKKRQRNRNGMSGFVMTKSIFPSEFKGVMTYNTFVSLAPAAGVPSTNSFRMNSVYDPDLTGVGSTAYGYSNLSALYSRYMVTGGRATVEFINLSTVVASVYIVLSPTNSVGIDLNKIYAQRFVWMDSLANTSSGPATLKHDIAFKIAPIYGVRESAVRDNDDFAGLVGGNPNNVVYMHVGGHPNGPSAANFNIQVRIEYDVIWSLPLLLTV